MTRQQKIYLFGSIAFVGGTYLIYRSIKRQQVYNLMIDKIAGGSVTVNNQKAVSVLTGQHHKNISSSKSFAMLSESKIREVAERIEDAVKGLGTNESKLRSEFQALRDKVAISQVASYYQGKYGRSLLDRLEGEGELQSTLIMIKSKPDVRWLS